MTFVLVYLGVFVILIWAFLLSSNLGAGYRYKFRAVSVPGTAGKFNINTITFGMHATQQQKVKKFVIINIIGLIT